MTAPNPIPNAVAGAWTDDELMQPHRSGQKQEKVRSMFASIAHRYDLNNRVHSLWRDQAWRRFAVRASGAGPGQHVLDVACGTGDLTEAFARSGAERVVGLDYTRRMLAHARLKRARRPSALAARIRYLQGDAQHLPFDDASFDVVSIAFGIRNVQEPLRAIAEFRRVLRPGGRLVILEFAEPKLAPVRWFNTLYCRRIMPVTATLLAGDRSGAYRYLPRSVETFMTPSDIAGAVTDAGFGTPGQTALSLGICVCTVAPVPTA